MKRHSAIQISIPTPCHVPLNGMQKTAEGRFCASCQKNVFDLRYKADEEVLEFLTSDQNSGCAILTPGQLNRKIKPARPMRSYYQYLISALLFTFILKNQAAAAARKYPTEQTETKKGPILRNDTVAVVEGIVRDSNEVLPYSVVQIQGSHIRAYTDTTGAFKIELPDSLKGKTLTFIISQLGYESISVTLSPNQMAKVQDFKLKKIANEMVAGGMIVLTKKQSRIHQLYSNLRYNIKRLFLSSQIYFSLSHRPS